MFTFRRFAVHSSIEKLEIKLGDSASSILPLEYGGIIFVIYVNSIYIYIL